MSNSTSLDNSTTFGGANNSTGNGTDPSFDDLMAMYWTMLYASHIDAKRLAAAFMAWVIYDFVITIDDSINLFWKYRWSVSKVMYLISRYASLFTIIHIAIQIFLPFATLSYCYAAPWMQFIGSSIILTIINLVMITRVYALWNRDIWILTFVLTGFSLNIGSYIIILSYTYAKAMIFTAIPPFTGCSVWPGYERTWIIFLTSIAFETFIICLTVYKSWSVASQRGIRTPLYTLILEDGLVYYFFIMASQILSMVALWVPSALSGPIGGAYPAIAVTSVACNRLFLRLQRLLLSRGDAQSGFATDEFWSSVSARVSYGGTQTRYSGPSRSSVGDARPQSRRTSASNRLSKPRRSSTAAMDSSDIGMENISRASMQHSRYSTMHGRPARSAWRGHQTHAAGNDGSIGSRISGSLDKEIDLTGHYGDIAEAVRMSQDMLDRSRHQSRTFEIPKDVEVEDGASGPFTSANGKSVLDPSPRFTGALSSAPSNDDVGGLIVSRVGRYE